MAVQVNRRYHIVLRLFVIPSKVEGSLELLTPLFFRHFSAPAQDFRFGAGGFSFLDVAGAIVE